ncbi:MAG: DUF1569 domain-containing protein [Acidobacteriota bacterium]
MRSVAFRVDDPEGRMDFLTRLLPEAIENLDEGTVPRWGEMTAQHMVEHLVWAFGLSTGKVEVTCEVPENQREVMKAWLYNNQPSPRGFKNPKLPEAPGPLRYSSIREAKSAFMEALDDFADRVKTNSGHMETHPLFGALRMDEWERVHFKHGYHHLVQFGLLGDAEQQAV